MPEKDEGELLAGEDRAFARSLRSAREDRGWSQAELADRLAAQGFEWLSRVTISRIESLRRAPRLGEARAIARVLGVSLSQMMSPGSGEFELIRGAFDRAGRAVQELEVAAGQAEVVAKTWLRLERDLALVEHLREQLQIVLQEEPELATTIERYLSDVRALLRIDPVALLGRRYEEIHDGAAANATE